MFRKVGRKSWTRFREGRNKRAGGSLHFFDAGLDIANREQVFVQLAAVSRAQRRLQTARVFHHEIEDALVIRALAGAALRIPLHISAAEQPFEHGLWTS